MSISILCVSDSDTRMKWTAKVAGGFAHLEPTVKVASLATEALPTQRQLEENQIPYEHFAVGLDEFFTNPVFMEFDVIIANMVGTKLFRLQDAIADYAAQAERRPVLVVGYAGVVYEKHVEGLLWRVGADIICVNSAHDHDLFSRVMDAVGLDTAALVRTGYPAIAVGESAAPSADPDPKTVTFAIQPDVPKTRKERLYILERFISYARANPEKRVIVKLRSMPGENTTHREQFNYKVLYDRHLLDRPPNLEFLYGNMNEVLEETDLLVTVSSTAALEAWTLGKNAAIITDLGVKEGLGNHFFVGSGALMSLNQLLRGEIPQVKSSWLENNGLSADDKLVNAADRAAQLVAQQTQAGTSLAMPDRFYTDDRTPYVTNSYGSSQSQKEGKAPSRLETAAQPVKKVVANVMHGAPLRAYRRLERWVSN